MAPGLRGLRTSCRKGMVEPLTSWWTSSRERWYRRGQSKIQLQWFSFSWVPPIKASRICQNSAVCQLGTSFSEGMTFSKVICKSRSSPGFSRDCLPWLYLYPLLFRLVPEPLPAWDVKGVCVYACTRACSRLCWLASPGQYFDLRTQSLLPIGKLSLLQLFKHNDFTVQSCLPFDMGMFTCVALEINGMEERSRRTQ